MSNACEFTAALTQWLDDTIARPHPDLGRSGAVCPYVPKARAAGKVEISACRGPLALDAVTAALQPVIAQVAEMVRARAPGEAACAAVVAFPETAVATVFAAQELLVDHVASLGLAIAVFSPDHPGRGLHNPAFRPMRAPWPLVVVRQTVRQDAVFAAPPAAGPKGVA